MICQKQGEEALQENVAELYQNTDEGHYINSVRKRIKDHKEFAEGLRKKFKELGQPTYDNKVCQENFEKQRSSEMSSNVLSPFGIGGSSFGSQLEQRGLVEPTGGGDDAVNTGRQQTVTPRDLRSKPGLPIFGTVSAASLIPSLNHTPAALANVNMSHVSQIMGNLFPGLNNIRFFDDYILSYDQRTRVANWVYEHVTPDSVRENDAVDRSKSDFTPDEHIHPYFRSLNSDYKGSGFDRGHMAAAGNHRAEQKHCDQTFFLSNMAPEVGAGFNRDKWNHLERYVRKLTKSNPNVYCCTGPLYLPRKEDNKKLFVRYQVIGENNVAVPTHFFKVVIMEMMSGQLEMEAYILPNDKIDNATPLTKFLVSPEKIERASGLLFFDKIARKKLSKINGKKVWIQ